LDSVPLLPGSWELTVPGYCFVAMALFASLLVRLVSTSLKWIERKLISGDGSEDRPEPAAAGAELDHGWWPSFLGKGKNGDALHGFWIGLLEFLGYPVILATGHLEAIGGWLALKALPPWKKWEVDRRAYVRFLICNLLVVGISFMWMTRCVEVKVAQPPTTSTLRGDAWLSERLESSTEWRPSHTSRQYVDQ
jgi:hypothetical protein